jgi:hypothetical protein
MPNIPQKAIEEMLRNADPQSRRVMKSILNGREVARIYCLSEDIVGTREVPVLDDDGNEVKYKTGEKAGQTKMTTEEFLQREGCKGRQIGVIYQTADGGTRVEPIKADDGNYYLRSTRKRLDGVMGCECWCGQDSRISKQEAGHIDFTGNAPTKEGLEAIFTNIQKNPTPVEEVDGRAFIDGFAFEGVA